MSISSSTFNLSNRIATIARVTKGLTDDQALQTRNLLSLATDLELAAIDQRRFSYRLGAPMWGTCPKHKAVGLDMNGDCVSCLRYNRTDLGKR